MPLTTIRTSRRPRRCARECGVPIRAGQQTEQTVIPPHGHDVLDSESWIRMISHAECPDPRALPAEELAAARAEMSAWVDARLEELKTQAAALRTVTA